MALIAIDYQRGARGRLQKGKHTGVYRGVSLLGECQTIEGRTKPKNSPRLPRHSRKPLSPHRRIPVGIPMNDRIGAKTGRSAPRSELR